MKQIYVVLFLLFAYSIANAQVKKDDIVLGGNLGYSDQGSSNQSAFPPISKSTGLSINPSLGKAIKDNLVLGVDVSYIHNSYKSTSGGVTNENQYNNGGALGVFVRRYKPIGAGFSLFGQAELSGNYSHGNESDPTSTQVSANTNAYGFSLSLFPGIAYALNRHWQIETSLPNFFVITYGHSKETEQFTGEPDQVDTYHNFGISTSLTGSNQFAVGVRYIIGS